MSHPFALSMIRPHEALGLHQPLLRRLPKGIVVWNTVLLAGAVVMSVWYIVQVNQAARQSFMLREMEKNVDRLRTETAILQDQLVMHSSVFELEQRARELGFEPVDSLEFVSPTSKSYALAR